MGKRKPDLILRHDDDRAVGSREQHLKSLLRGQLRLDERPAHGRLGETYRARESRLAGR